MKTLIIILASLEQEEIRKLTFAVVANLFRENRRILLCLFQVLFMMFLPYLAVSYGQQVEAISERSKYCHCYILKRQKVLNHGLKLENNKAKQFSIREGLALVVALSPKRQMIR